MKEVGRIYTYAAGVEIRAASDGGVWTLSEPTLGKSRISRYEASEVSSNLNVSLPSSESAKNAVEASTSSLFADPLLQAADLSAFDINQDTGNLLRRPAQSNRDLQSRLH